MVPISQYLVAVRSMRIRLIAVCLTVAASLVLPFARAYAWDRCVFIDHAAAWEDRHGRAPSATTQDELRALFENPTVIESAAVATDEAGASIETRTETHAVYPVSTTAMTTMLTTEEILESFMPNLGDHEVVCQLTDSIQRQRQSTDFGVLIFTLATEYVIDVETVAHDEQTFASRWVLVDSLDERMAYIYGSWYFEAVTLDGRPATYVRHYGRTGLTTRVPGVRHFIDRRLENEITNLFTVFYEATAERYGRTALR